MLSHLLTTPVTIHRRSPADDTVNDYGDPVATYETVETVGELQQRTRQEPEGHGELSDTGWVLFLPAETTLDTGDRVTANGLDFEVIGDAWPVRNPRTGLASHVEATLRRAA